MVSCGSGSGLTLTTISCWGDRLFEEQRRDRSVETLDGDGRGMAERNVSMGMRHLELEFSEQFRCRGQVTGVLLGIDRIDGFRKIDADHSGQVGWGR